MSKAIIKVGTVLLLSLSMLPVSLAQVKTETVKFVPPKSMPKILVSDLAKLKTAELDKKWSDCVMFARRSFSKNPDVKPWVLISWLKCSRQFAAEKKGTESLVGALKAFDPNRSFLISGPWKEELKNEMIKARVQLLDLLPRAQREEMWRQVDALLSMPDLLDREQKAKAYYVAGELSQAQTQLRMALSFYEKSLNEMENKPARDKYNGVLFTLNKTAPTPMPQAAARKPEVLSADEAKFEERINSALKTNDLVALVDDSISYLHKFPNGKRAKWAQDRVQEVYMGVLDRSRDEKMYALKEKLLSSMMKADPLRVLDWSRALHRRGDFSGALKLSEKSLDVLEKSAQASTLLYIAGRSAQLSGEYKKARKHFEQYVEAHSGAEDINEVLFRLGLVHLRLQQHSSAIAVFEKLLVQPNIDRYELSSRYWLARSLQSTSNPRASQEIETILQAYPFSYYALRLRAERMAGALDWPTDSKYEKELKADFYWTNPEKKVWDRIKILSENGWVAEALSEYLTLQTPTGAPEKILTAQKLASGGVFPPVVKLINDAGDLNSDLRSLDIVSMSFPQVYKEAIEREAKKQKLSPILVRSLIRQESAFGVRAVSTSNALGLMQLIPPTAAEVAQDLSMKIDVPSDVFNPDVNIQLGTSYIAKMINQFGKNVPLGLAAYNAGPTRMRMFVNAREEVAAQMGKKSYDLWDELWYDEVPWFETSFYVKAILRNSLMYKLLERSTEKNPDLRRVQWAQGLNNTAWGDLVLPE